MTGVVLFIVVVILLLICIPIIIGIFYCLTLQKALSRCAPQNRAMSPGLVWLFLIPVFNMVWHFFIVINMAKSLQAEFAYRGIQGEPSPGQNIGLAACILHVLSCIPYVGFVAGIGFLVCWIMYWVKIAGFSDRIAVPYAAPVPPTGSSPAA